MPTLKLSSGSQLPEITLPIVGGGTATLDKPQNERNWRLVFVYRGWHCPICKQYLTQLQSLKDKFLAAGAEVIAVSGDPEHKAVSMLESVGLTFPVAYGLSIAQMKDLGLYISHPRSEQETNQPFSEPGMFAINTDRKVHLIDISNTPFNRADLGELIETVEWVRANQYPIRGTFE